MTDDPVNQSTNQPPLDLSAPERFIQLKLSGKTARHFFRRITLEEWQRYVQLLGVEAVVEGESWRQESNEAAAAEWLWGLAILRIEGYRAGDDFKEKMPLGHKLAALELLQEVYFGEETDGFDLESDNRTITLEAAWNGQVFPRLVHRLRPPTLEEEKKFRRSGASWHRDRGTRQHAQRLRSAPRLKEMCELYDALIVAIEGYTGFSSPKECDPIHKQAAVLRLFEKPDGGSKEQI